MLLLFLLLLLLFWCRRNIFNDNRIEGAALIAPVVNYWWTGFPANLSNAAFNQEFWNDRLAYSVCHHTPWLTYWWNTQKWFPSSSVLVLSSDVLSSQDKVLANSQKRQARKKHVAQVTQQGEYESVHRDLIVGFGKWEFSPVELENPFLNDEGSVHLWHGDEDMLVPVLLQRYIAQQLPWIHYHELPGAGHLFPESGKMWDTIIKELVPVKE